MEHTLRFLCEELSGQAPAVLVIFHIVKWLINLYGSDVMFTCPKCKLKIDLPICKFCGNEITNRNNIWQLSDMPDIVTEGDGDKYIGYEYIGESYSGKRKYLIEERDYLFAKEIYELTGDGIFLDLACGDGCFTIPCASFHQ
jgi:hypothetical protein